MPCNRPFPRTGFRKREKDSEINKRRKDQPERRGENGSLTRSCSMNSRGIARIGEREAFQSILNL